MLCKLLGVCGSAPQFYRIECWSEQMQLLEALAGRGQHVSYHYVGPVGGQGLE
jgi:hypothetical protein